MTVKRILALLLLLLLPVFLWGCASEAAAEDPIYLDENGDYDFGDWAFELNGADGVAAMYDLSDEELHDLLEEMGYLETGSGVTVESARRDWRNGIIFLAQCSDEELMEWNGADEEGIEKFRTYVADKFGDVSDIVLEDYPPSELTEE